MKRLAPLALLMLLAATPPAHAWQWPCSMVRGYAASKGLGPPLTPEKQKKLDALASEHNVSPEDQKHYATCFKAPPQAAPAQKRGRKGRRHA